MDTPSAPRTWEDANNDSSQASMGRLFRDLANDLSELTRKEIQLAQTEMTEKVSHASKAVISMAAGGFVAYAGLLVLMAAAVLGLATYMPYWLSAVIVGGLALITPAVLSSGHSALQVGFGAYYTAPVLVMLIGLKVLAAAISIGSGFRGGLFFASLFLGAMLGKLVALGWMLVFGLNIPGLVVAIIGMCAMATAVLGAPLTMGRSNVVHERRA